MRISVKTDVGLTRSVNQDAFSYGEFSETAAWAVVCDGMGGASAGDVASSVASSLIAEKLKKSFSPDMNSASVINLIKSVVETANSKLYSMASENPDLQGMGTTVVVAIISGSKIYIANAGDSRAYYYCKENGLTQITKDHSVVQAMVELGEITPDEARNHPRKNIITRALGVEDTIELDFYENEMDADGVLLICSDGLTNYVVDEEIEKLIVNTEFDKLAEVLVDSANEKGGGDNITVVTVASC